MATSHFLTKAEEQQVIDAIARAERQTSGEVRVHIEEHCESAPLQRADRLFNTLGMTHTDLQNGVLVYVAWEDKKAAIYAGKGIHTKVEKNFWQDVLQLLLNHFKTGQHDLGLVEAVDKIGLKLSELFPHRKGDVNELTNEISYND